MMDSINRLIFSVKVGKSYKNHSWSISRDSAFNLIPFLPYEGGCDIIVDGVPARARLNIEPRIFFNKDQVNLVNHLCELAKKDRESRIDLELLLNKNNSEFLDNSVKIKELEYIIKNKDLEISRLNEHIIRLKNENKKLREEI